MVEPFHDDKVGLLRVRHLRSGKTGVRLNRHDGTTAPGGFPRDVARGGAQERRVGREEEEPATRPLGGRELLEPRDEPPARLIWHCGRKVCGTSLPAASRPAERGILPGEEMVDESMHRAITAELRVDPGQRPDCEGVESEAAVVER